MRRWILLSCLLAAVTAVPCAVAGTQDWAVVALHSGAHLLKGDTPCDWGGMSCADFQTEWPSYSAANLYLVVAQGRPDPGIGGLSCGIEYGDNLAVYGWTLCASGLQFPNDGGQGDWPASGGGNRITWDASVDCQRIVYGSFGVHALAGSFYVYAYGPDRFRVTPNNNLQSGPEFQVVDCANTVTNLDPWMGGAVGFGGELGLDPCIWGPVRTTTWGAIKARY